MNKIVLNYGLSRKGSFSAVPFHIINGVPCNYAFIKKLDDGVCYNSEAGIMKEESLRAIGMPFEIVDIQTGTQEQMQADIVKAHSLYEARDALSVIVLYRFERTIHDDTIFYNSLNIRAETSEPVDFATLNREPQEPFTSISISRLCSMHT